MGTIIEKGVWPGLPLLLALSRSHVDIPCTGITVM